MSANFQDVDGNSFELLASDDMSREIEAQRRATAEKLESERRAVQELEIAKQVQARLFPQMLPPLKTLDYAGICIQARQVGGDYYDFLSLGEDRLGLVVSDVSGKGIAAALLMANLQANLRSQCAIALDHPERLLRSVNHVFYGPPTALTRPSSSPNTTTGRRACATRIVDICPAFCCGATTPWSGSIQLVCQWDSLANGIA